MLIEALGANVAENLVRKIMVATSLGYRTYMDNKDVDANVMEAALSEDPDDALNNLIASFDDKIEAELERSRQLRGVSQ